VRRFAFHTVGSPPPGTQERRSKDESGNFIHLHEGDAAGGVGAGDLKSVGARRKSHEQGAVAAVFGERKRPDDAGGGADLGGVEGGGP
jgi:hypothetical protein